MVFLRSVSQHIEMNPYNAEEFVSMAELKERVKKAREMKHRLRLDLMRENQPHRQGGVGTVRVQARQVYVRVEGSRKAQQAYRQGCSSCYQFVTRSLLRMPPTSR